jgi:hypothetical protein
VLRELDAEMTRRSVAYKRAGVTRFADLRQVAAEEGQRRPLPRILCVIDEFQVLLAGNDPIATEAGGPARVAGPQGPLVRHPPDPGSQTVLGVEALYAKRDSIFGQFPVRIALPGGGDVLEPTNDSAAGLPLGTAVVNTAGGLGGPRGATRGHERVVRFPDPARRPRGAQRLRTAVGRPRPRGDPPRIFAGLRASASGRRPDLPVGAGRSRRPARPRWWAG